MVHKVYVQTPEGKIHPYQTRHDYKFAVAVRNNDVWTDWHIGGHHKTLKAAQTRARWFQQAPENEVIILPVTEEASS